MQLGEKTKLPTSPDDAILDKVNNPRPLLTATDRYLTRFTFPEFSAICPVTGQPDFAIMVIEYVPDAWLIESKSLKLYLNSFRNHGAFHEDCTNKIGIKICSVIKPVWLRVSGYFNPRGGIPIDVFWQSSTIDNGVWIPPHDIGLYKGR